MKNVSWIGKNYYNIKTCIRINKKYNKNGPQHKFNHT
jgi:hypothetical protein